MAKKSQPNHAKPYSQKIAERNSAKRSMRTGGDMPSFPSLKMRPDTPMSKSSMPSSRRAAK